MAKSLIEIFNVGQTLNKRTSQEVDQHQINPKFHVQVIEAFSSTNNAIKEVRKAIDKSI